MESLNSLLSALYPLLSTLWSLTSEMAPYLLFGFFVAGLLHAFVPHSVYQRHLSRPGFRSVLNATLLGVPLPLCSCGVIPTTVALRRAGASAGACTSFLIATPQTGVDSILATYSLLGLPFAILRPLAALVTGVLGGLATDLLVRSGRIAKPAEASTADTWTVRGSLLARFKEALCYGFGELLEDVGRWLVIGLVVAALITVFVPSDFFVALQGYPIVNMLLVLVVAIPMYLCATGSIPIAMSLLMKGLTPGAALVMLMAGPAVNAASLLVVGKALGRGQMTAYLGSIVAGAVVFGLIIDYLLPAAWFVPSAAYVDPCCAVKSVSLATVFSTTLFLILLLRALYARQFGNKHNHDDMPSVSSHTMSVEGMRCSHCAANCREAVLAVDGVESVEVDLPSGRVMVTGTFDEQKVSDAINQAGYRVI